MQESPHATTFLITSEDPSWSELFQGYCFHGADYVYGPEGRAAFEAETGQELTGGLDGCYVLARRQGDRVVLTTDYSGYKLLYHYHDGRTWAVSNSVAQIVDFLRARGIPIRPGYAELAAILTTGSATSQLSSFETVVRGIRLAPRGHDLVVGPTGVALERRPVAEAPDYVAGLRGHLELWVRRFETLLLDEPTGLIVDVTGGVDSRTTFGMLARARQRLAGRGGLPRLNCGHTPSDRSDLDVAETLTAHYGLPLNDGRRFPRHSLGPEETYRSFRDLNVGSSFTLYLPVEGPHPRKVTVTGSGGENHRKFYERHSGASTLETFLTSYGTRLHHPWLGPDFVRHGLEAVQLVGSAGADPLRVHYREFRHRFHGGRASRYGVAFTPLDSASADATQSWAGADRLADGQFNYDVLASLDPALLDLDFDSPEKAPSPAVRDRLTVAPVSPDAGPGRVWAADQPDREAVRSARQRAEQLMAAVEEACSDQFVLDFWGMEVIEQASELLDRLVGGEGIGNPVNGKPISALLAAYLASPTPRPVSTDVQIES